MQCVKRLGALCVLIIVPFAAAAADTMQAMVLESGGTLALQTVDRPTPAAAQVRIKVAAAGVNPADWKMAARMSKAPGAPPVLGLDAAGVIDAVGPAVAGWKAGDAVIALVRPPHGSFGEYALAGIESVAAKPRKLTMQESAGIPVAGETAWRSLVEVAHLQHGQTVLITGGAGGVGSAAVQIAKALGAHVIATASAHNLEFMRSIGADDVVDYTAAPFEQKIKGVDVVLNTVDPDTGVRSIATVKPGGLIVSIVGPTPPDRCEAAKIRCAMPDRATGKPSAEYLAEVVKLADAGKFRVNVERVFPLREAQKALELNRQGHTRGKIVLAVTE
jgi:NADPH:quinone reductase-like Zn-dependent oxidoreductase